MVECIKFTGGDSLTGIMKLYHDVLMKNELRNGCGAYELSWAGTPKNPGKSGPSFGGNQMDIGSNNDAREILLGIIKGASDKNSKPLFRKDEVLELSDILDHDNAKNLEAKSPKQVFGDKLERINQALSSNYGREAINKAYLAEMGGRANIIEIVVNNIKHPAAKAFYDSDMGRTLLLDFHNQYGGISKNGPLVKYTNGEEVTLFTGKKLSIKDKGEFTMDEHREFVYNLKQANNNQKDYKNTVQRLDNIEKYLAELNKAALPSATPLESSEVQGDKIINYENCQKLYKVFATLNGRFPELKMIPSGCVPTKFKETLKVYSGNDINNFIKCFHVQRIPFESIDFKVDKAVRPVSVEECTLASCYAKDTLRDKNLHKIFITFLKECKEIMDDHSLNASYDYMIAQSNHEEL